MVLNPMIQPQVSLSGVEEVRHSSYVSELVTSLEGFQGLKSEWKGLLDAMEETRLNLDHGWLYAWLKNFDSTGGFIILVRDENKRLIAAAPFKVSRPKAGLNRRVLRHLQFIGTEPCLYDEMKILIHPDLDEERILKTISEKIMEAASQWDVIDLRYSPDEHQLTRLMAQLKPTIFKGQVEQTMSCPYFDLPSNQESYEAAYPKNRKKRKRHHNQINRDFKGKAFEFQWLTDESEIQSELDCLIQRHVAYWKERGVCSGFQRYANMKRFYQDLLAGYPTQQSADGQITLGRVRFSVLKIDGNPVSYDIGLHQGDGYLGHLGCYSESFKRYGPGFLHAEALIENAIEAGDTRFYFGRGDEAHKFNWADKKQSLFNLLLFKNRPAYFLWQADEALKSGVHGLKTIVKGSC